MSKHTKPTLAEIFYSWAMLPVYAWQGLSVRRKTHRMLPPANRGIYHHAGTGQALRLLVLGDSSAAGVGVGKIEHSFSGLLPAFLNERSGRPVTA